MFVLRGFPKSLTKEKVSAKCDLILSESSSSDHSYPIISNGTKLPKKSLKWQKKKRLFSKSLQSFKNFVR
ncbi:hypothetical protein AP75_11130 [Kaistella haifensis DSM 19056]|uniref:Uncharacterized protein n=1 Tax=Kaistella haifensis DSM 19056 TaxID=1450526 RepID=A0A246B7X6_9FLAO|nr:hypothetical protein AP75_11130 [Kaistella haifensis DSM 19056]